MIELDETSFNFNLSPDLLEKVSDREALLNEIGEYLVTEILNYVGEGKSPIAGVAAFKKLNKHYANAEKGGDRLANLDLFGDMLNSLTFEPLDNGVTVGIFDEDQAIKSYGHNTGFKGHPVLEGRAPKRQFIPEPKQLLKADIIRGVSRIVEEYLTEGDNGAD